MTQTGYQDILFTEINPTSTTTMITMFYNPGYGQTVFTLGPVTILTNPLTQTTPTVTQPATVTVVPTVTVDSVPTTTTKSSAISSSTLVQPSCELIIAIPFLIAFWLLVLSVSLALLSPLSCDKIL
jgi:hypothetical protein